MLLKCDVGEDSWESLELQYSLEGLILKLKLQYFGHLMRRTDSLEKILMLGKIEGRRRRGQERIKWLDGITNSMDMSLSNSGSWWWTGRPGVLQSMGSQRVGHDRVTELNWWSACKIPTTKCYSLLCNFLSLSELKSVILISLKITGLRMVKGKIYPFEWRVQK